MKRLLPAAMLAALAALALEAAGSTAADPPRTGFEESDGAEWTAHDDELEFLAAVDAASARVTVEEIGRTAEGRPLHLVRVGHPTPRAAAAARAQPVYLNVCSQHGNEPAGREACLIWLRDLAFTTDPELVAQLSTQTVLFVPSANPDGREANDRENSEGVDVNRDHLNLESNEARAIAAVIRDWQPDLAIDLHEYGPGTPVLYDDEVLYLWPRNLNVDDEVHDLGVSFSKEVLAPCLTEAGYTSDEYGIDAAGPVDVQQTAGGGDEGIMRNAAGLRHAVGILIESAVTMNVTNGPDEATTAGVQRRRVASHVATVRCALDYLRENAATVVAATAGAPVRKTVEGRNRSAKVYFSGQDEDTTLAGNGDEEVSADPPCGYDLSAAQYRSLRPVLDLHGIAVQPRPAGVRVPMAQPAEPVIPLLLDARNTDRAATDGTPLDNCGGATTGPGGSRPSPRPDTGARPGPGIPATGLPAAVAAFATLAAGLAAGVRRLAGGR